MAAPPESRKILPQIHAEFMQNLTSASTSTEGSFGTPGLLGQNGRASGLDMPTELVENSADPKIQVEFKLFTHFVGVASNI